MDSATPPPPTATTDRHRIFKTATPPPTATTISAGPFFATSRCQDNNTQNIGLSINIEFKIQINKKNHISFKEESERNMIKNES
jgi:hypothetical protein